MNRMNNRFQGGFSGTTYKCGVCGKNTRETGQGESSCDLCAFCYLESGLENSFSDGGGVEPTREQFLKEIAKLEARYKRHSPEHHAAIVAMMQGQPAPKNELMGYLSQNHKEN